MQLRTRQRLVGLLLLGVLAAILAPLLLRTPTEVRLALDMDIPEMPDLPELQEKPELTSERQEMVLEEVEQARAEVLDAAEEQGDTATLDIPSTTKITTPTAWVVQVGSFSSEQLANELAVRLRDKGYPAYVRKQQEEQGLYRVLVGPELARADADELKYRLSKDSRFKLNGFVAPYDL